MELGSEDGKVQSSRDVCKSKKRNKKKKKDGTEAGCWVNLSFIGSCISSRSKVDSSVSGTSTHFGNSYFCWVSPLWINCFVIFSLSLWIGLIFFLVWFFKQEWF
ncbi:hypothetical protein OIU76_011125 [Salix suchowensis]|nr:hypothetical protein OIU76_011125 [Salix suchowensis]